MRVITGVDGWSGSDGSETEYGERRVLPFPTRETERDEATPALRIFEPAPVEESPRLRVVHA